MPKHEPGREKRKMVTVQDFNKWWRINTRRQGRKRIVMRVSERGLGGTI
jgi:hypothetical protein